MDKARREKIKRFMADKMMSDIIKDEIRNSFMKSKPKQQDVHVLAAKSLSIDSLEEAFKNLEKKAAHADGQELEHVNIGL